MEENDFLFLKMISILDQQIHSIGRDRSGHFTNDLSVPSNSTTPSHGVIETASFFPQVSLDYQNSVRNFPNIAHAQTKNPKGVRYRIL